MHIHAHGLTVERSFIRNPTCRSIIAASTYRLALSSQSVCSGCSSSGGPPDYSCTGIPKTFISKGSLTRHQKTFGHLPPTSELTENVSPLCNVSRRSRSGHGYDPRGSRIERSDPPTMTSSSVSAPHSRVSATPIYLAPTYSNSTNQPHCYQRE